MKWRIQIKHKGQWLFVKSPHAEHPYEFDSAKEAKHVLETLYPNRTDDETRRVIPID